MKNGYINNTPSLACLKQQYQAPRSAEVQLGKKYKLQKEAREVATTECKGINSIVKNLEFIKGGNLPQHDSQTPRKAMGPLVAELSDAAAHGDYYNNVNLPVIRSSRSSVDSSLLPNNPIAPQLYRHRSD